MKQAARKRGKGLHPPATHFLILSKTLCKLLGLGLVEHQLSLETHLLPGWVGRGASNRGRGKGGGGPSNRRWQVLQEPHIPFSTPLTNHQQSPA